jgi:hypothetical protein
MFGCNEHVYATYVVVVESKDTCGITKEGINGRGEGLVN